MRTRFPLAISATTMIIALGGFTWLASSVKSQDTGAPPPAPVPADPSTGPELPAPAEGDDTLMGAEVLTRGPVHEAFASPTQLDPEPTPVVAKKPPDSIEEVPPDDRPEGDNVIWIPGYWAWDDDRNDYLWVSGLYRNAPPKQTWVSGYWNQVEGGYQWTPGFWTAASQDEVSYLEQAPPASLEAGPSSPAPSEDHFWIPGYWTYQAQAVNYAWRPGYWAVAQTNWMWVPARYVWCPSGYVFVPGYWDYLPVSRGCLFAPVYFTQPIYYQPAFVYRPAVVISTGFFTSNLFCRPSYGCYYFGDYFAARYTNVGFRPWFSVNVRIGGRPCYDPFFSYYNCHNRRHDRDWLVRTERRYDNLRRDERARPPHTYIAAKNVVINQNTVNINQQNNTVIAKTLKEVKKDRDSNVKLRNVDRDDREKFVKQAAELKRVSKERGEIEKKTDIARAPKNLDRLRNGDGKADPKAVVKMSDKKLKLPTVASTKTDVTPRNRKDVSKAVDAAKKNTQLDRSSKTSSRVVDVDKKPMLDNDSTKKNIDRVQSSNNKPKAGLSQTDIDQRRTDRSVRDTTNDAKKKAIDRARTSVDRDAKDGPALTQPEAIKRQITEKNNSDAKVKKTTIDAIDQQRRSVSRPPVNATPRGSTTTTSPRNLNPSQSNNLDFNRELRSKTQTQTITPRSSAQPKIQVPSGGGSSSGSRSPALKPKGNDDKERSKKRSNRSADVDAPRSNIDIAAQPPTMSNIPGKVEQEVKSARNSIEGSPDEFTERVREVVRGDPIVEKSENTRSAPPNDLRSPSLFGPGSPQPNQRGLTQSDSGGPAPDGELAVEKQQGHQGGDAKAPKPSSELTEGARPGQNPRSRYDSLLQHGKTLSRTTVRERPGTVDEAGNIDPRKAKDPIGSIGYGATPQRSGTPRAYGPLGQLTRGGTSGSQQSVDSGSGSVGGSVLPRWQSSQLPKMQRMPRNNAAPSRSSNPADRTYDPTRK